jgi:hypothetical protein
MQVKARIVLPRCQQMGQLPPALQGDNGGRQQQLGFPFLEGAASGLLGNQSRGVDEDRVGPMGARFIAQPAQAGKDLQHMAPRRTAADKKGRPVQLG